MHFLLLNPPGKLPYSRDYFCSKVTKAGYAEHPIDLLILSGIISSAGHRVSLIDAIVEGLDFNTTKERVVALGADAIIFLSGSTTWKDDFAFLSEIKYAHPSLFVLGLGDIFLDNKMFLNNNWLDAVIVDFSKDEFLKYIYGQSGNFESLCFRRGSDVHIPSKRKSSGEFRIPIPRHELFLNNRYSFPFARRLPFTTILTDYGCPFGCPFCIYPTLGFKVRALDNVLEEMRYVYSLGIKELFIKDQSFGANRNRTIKLCEGMRKIGDFSWTCFLRTDIVDLELLTAMKDAGCHTVIFGIETANEEMLKKYKPGVNRRNIEDAFTLCRNLGIDTVGIFILGFPGEDKNSCLESIDFALRLKCDFASFNLFVPKIQTPVREDLIKNHILNIDKNEIFDQSGIASVWQTSLLTQRELDSLRRFAVSRFYLRPFYIIKRLFKSLRSKTQLKMLISSACFIIRDITKKRLF